jgi:hypothetical protein
VSEVAQIKNWHRQFDGRQGSAKTSLGEASEVKGETSLLRPKNIPFGSRYIQSEPMTKKSEVEMAAAEFDPSRPPPPVSSKGSVDTCLLAFD